MRTQSPRAAAVILALAALLGATSRARAADDKNPLARARQQYNEGHFEAAIDAADQARRAPAQADRADLIAARAYLERYRQSEADDDLTSARERLRQVDGQKLDPRERVEFVVGLGEAMYFDGKYGAAADLFASVLAREDGSGPDARERVLDWWATALDRDTRPRSDIDRQAVYQRIRERMRQELGSHPSSAAAAYWLSAAARGQGDLQSAWAAAEAAWIRAPLTADQGVALRADVDQLVTRALVPERARALAQPPDAVRAEWEEFKARWSK